MSGALKSSFSPSFGVQELLDTGREEGVREAAGGRSRGEGKKNIP